MAATRTTQNDILRTVYQDQMRLQFNLKSILMQRIGRDNATYAEGEKISLPLHFGRTGGYGWSPTGKLPPAGEQEPKRAEWNYERLYGRIQIDRAHMRGAAKSYAAEVRPFDWETQSIVKQLRNSLNFMLFGDGSGILTDFAATDATSSGGTTTLYVNSLKGLHKNQMVDLLAVADGSPTNGFRYGKIASITRATKKVTVTVADWTVTTFNANKGDYGLYQSLDDETSSYGNVVAGLQAVIDDDNTYGGINRATAGNEPWHGQKIDAGTAQVPCLSLVEEGIDLVDMNSDGATDLIITTHELWTHLMNSLIDQKRFAGERSLNGWARALDFNGIPIVRDKHCPDGMMFLLDTSTLRIYQDSEGAWMDEDGAILHRVQDYEAYEATWSRYLQLICDKPNANCLIYDLVTTYPALPS